MAGSIALPAKGARPPSDFADSGIKRLCSNTGDSSAGRAPENPPKIIGPQLWSGRVPNGECKAGEGRAFNSGPWLDFERNAGRPSHLPLQLSRGIQRAVGELATLAETVDRGNYAIEGSRT